jgi:NADH-quinone oxidoreductase subunit M
MPIFVNFFFFFNISNMGMPGTWNFSGELLIYLGAFKLHPLYCLFCSCGAVFSAVYCLWLHSRLCYGTLRYNKLYFRDIKYREFFILIPFFIFTLFFGLFPNIILDNCYYSIQFLLFCIKFKGLKSNKFKKKFIKYNLNFGYWCFTVYIYVFFLVLCC